MDSALLRTFEAAARLGSLRRAAEELFLSPPAVTVQVRRLEREAGCVLFARTAAGVRLTPAGWWLLPRARAALAELDAAREGLLAFREGAARRVTLACSPFVARSALPFALAELRTQRPELDFAVDVVASAGIAAAVAAGRADLGLSLLAGPAGAGRRGGRARPAAPVRAERLWSEPVVLVVPAAGAAGDGGAPHWRDLIRSRLLLTGSHPAVWDELLPALRRLGALGRTMPVTDMDITRRFILEGLGLSFLPASAVGSEVRTGRLVALPTPGLQPPASAVYAVRAGEAGRAPAAAGAGSGPDADAGAAGASALVAALRRRRA